VRKGESNTDKEKRKSLSEKIKERYKASDEGGKEKIKERLKKAKEEMENSGKDVVSWTDPESRFMKNKKGRIEYSYNSQITVESGAGIIVANDVVQEYTDVDQLKPQIENVKENIGKLREGTEVSADNGYYNGENLAFLDDEKLDGYIPDSKIAQEMKGKELEENLFAKENFTYDEEKDEFICPSGKRLTFRYEYFDKSKGRDMRIYKGIECEGCIHRDECTKSKRGIRTIKCDKYEKEREKMALKMSSKMGREKYKIRCKTVEWVFGDIKQNLGLREFLTRGPNSVKVEFDLVCTAHNLKIIWGILKGGSWSSNLMMSYM